LRRRHFRVRLDAVEKVVDFHIQEAGCDTGELDREAARSNPTFIFEGEYSSEAQVESEAVPSSRDERMAYVDVIGSTDPVQEQVDGLSANEFGQVISWHLRPLCHGPHPGAGATRTLLPRLRENELCVLESESFR
tara:strand:- start:17 stop:421 length:405 start_codon:yes stop_codon:yes gene_type:complete